MVRSAKVHEIQMFWSCYVIISAITAFQGFQVVLYYETHLKYQIVPLFFWKCFKFSDALLYQELEEELHNARQELCSLQSYSSSLAGQLSSKEREVAATEGQLSQLRWAPPTEALPRIFQCLFSCNNHLHISEFFGVISLVKGGMDLPCVYIHMYTCIHMYIHYFTWVTLRSS